MENARGSVVRKCSVTSDLHSNQDWESVVNYGYIVCDKGCG